MQSTFSRKTGPKNFEVESSLRLGDALPPIFSNTVLEKEVKDMHGSREMKVVGKATLLAHADDIVVLGCSQNDVEKSTTRLIRSSERMRFSINEIKTKYTVMSRCPRILHNLTVGQYTFGEVENCKYSGVNLNDENDMHNEIRLRLNAENHEYYTMNSKCLTLSLKKPKGSCILLAYDL